MSARPYDPNAKALGYAKDGASWAVEVLLGLLPEPPKMFGPWTLDGAVESTFDAHPADAIVALILPLLSYREMLREQHEQQERERAAPLRRAQMYGIDGGQGLL
jgi:hypothetical protein